MQNSLDQSHSSALGFSPSTDSVHAVAVTLTETKHAVDKVEPRDAAPLPIASEEHRERVAVAAYFIAEHRGFEAGHEMEDWIAAEREILEREGGAPG